MGEDMEKERDFKEVKAFFESLDKEHKPFDLQAYYDNKTKNLKSLIARYLSHINFNSFWEETLGKADFGGKADLARNLCLIEIFKNVLKMGGAPNVKLTEEDRIKILPIALLAFYSEIRPAEIDLATILKLEESYTDLSNVVTALNEKIPMHIKKVKHGKGVKKGKQIQKEETFGRILRTYREMGVDRCGKNPKKPFVIKEVKPETGKQEIKEYSRGGLAGKISSKLDGDPTKEHIANCLKELHEKGEI